MEQTESVDEIPLEPRIYEVTMKDGKKHTVSGFLGVNDVFMAVVDTDNRMVFASAIGNVDNAKAVVEVPILSRAIN